MASPTQKSRRILLAANHLARVNRLREQLEPAGFQTEPAGDWSGLARHLQQDPADAILGDFDELAEAATFCTRLRTAGIGIPLLLLLPTDKCQHRDSLEKLGAQGCLPHATETGLLRRELESLCSAPAPESAPVPLIVQAIPATRHIAEKPAPVEPPVRHSDSEPAPSPAAASEVHPLDSPDRQAAFAAGIAHGFSECLTAIVGYANLLLEAPNLPLLPRRDAEGILKAAHQGTQLTRRLLAIGRKQVLRPGPVELAGTLLAMQPALKAIAGPKTDLRMELERSIPPVFLDASVLRQALFDLVGFLRGGQTGSGTLAIRSAPAPSAGQGSAPGRVLLTLSSSTMHLSDEELGRLFIPFGRENPAGALDGLSLASVQGALLQSGATIAAARLPPSGLQFVLDFPAAAPAEPRPAAPDAEAREVAPAPTGTLLLADDEELLRGVAVRILEEAGFRVLVARNGIEALELASQHPGRIDLLLTDVVMPKMGGFELATRLRARHPQLKVLFMSGFSEGGLFPHQAERSGLMFLQKPFSPAILLSRIRSMLVERAQGNSHAAHRRE